MAAAPAPDWDSQPESAKRLYQILRFYRDECGFSVFPVDTAINGRHDDRKAPHPALLPGRKWGAYQRRKAGDAELYEWATYPGGINVGVVLGRVSETYVWDIDNADFAAWLEEHCAPFLAQTYVVRTGSGLLHVYLKSAIPVLTTVFACVGPDGKPLKLADIRGDGRDGALGSYVVAPPSLHRLGGRYTRAYGDPRRIPKPQSAVAVMDRVKAAYVAHLGGGATATGTPARTSAATGGRSGLGMRILPPLPEDGDARRELQRRLHRTLRPKMSRTVLRGYDPDEWGHFNGDRSRMDYSVCRALIRAGFTDDEVEAIFATYPVGNRYRDRGHGHHGRSYLDQTLGRARADHAAERERAREARGPGWEIAKAIRFDYDVPEYHLTFALSSGTTLDGKFFVNELMQFRQFKAACMRELNWVPTLQKAHEGTGIADLAAAIAAMAEREQVAVEATSAGHLKTLVLQQLRRDIRDLDPEQPGDFRLGFRLGDTVYIRPTSLLLAVEAIRRENDLRTKLWDVVRTMGGEEKRPRVGANGRQERLWALPAKILERD